MQNLAPTNSDARPLPKGWVQHYESSKQLWYYVQITVMPPKVSFTHPADLLSTTTASSSGDTPSKRSRSPAPFEPTPDKSIPPTIQPSAQTQGMTLAQRLYASSGNSDAKPMIDHSSITNLSTAPEAPNPTTPRIGSLPTPPPSTPPSNDDSRYPGRSVTPLGAFHPSPSNGPIPKLYSVTSEPQIRGGFQLVGGSDNVHLPIRSQTTQPVLSHSMQAKNYPFSNISSGPSTDTAFGARRTPHLITTARPPTEPRRRSVELPHSPHTSRSSLALISEMPPTSSLLFSPNTPPSKPILSPISTPPSSLKSPRKHGSPVSEVSTISTITPTNCHKYPHLSAAGNHMKGIYNLSGALPRRPDPKKLMAALKIAFTKAGNGVSESDMQRVANADPNANYQAIINALKFQQQQYQQQTNSQLDLQSSSVQSRQPPALTVNYQALIVDIENLRVIGHAQAQQAAEQARQAQEAHEKVTEALRKQRAALIEQQAMAHQQAQQAAASRAEQLQQQQHQAAAKLHSQQKQHKKMAAHQQQLAQQKLLQQEQANQAYHRQLEAWQLGGTSPARMDAGASSLS
ncbi:hypothetical protein CPB83DRAFT_858077 [Crepidotus variabilis]|uniref:WW domain-containing protein n=1 Tax=Crepidotus variabilis TaxID=179855 RepID=A0A9P6JMF6_9AGAR|nr:hypothetical protein CPB83DRAFT_858077 [Crepidotus variabilis]